jgi:sugar fermentation stimulation protein A
MQLITFEQPAINATFVRRYKRFFCDVLAPNIQCNESNGLLTIHCANSGSMKSCLDEGAPCLIMDSNNPSRKLRFGLEGTSLIDGWACLNTLRANQAFRSLMGALHEGKLTSKPFAGSDLVIQDFANGQFRSEAVFDEGTRFDGCIEEPDDNKSWIEIKSVSLRLSADSIAFPDAVTSRGTRHLQKLQSIASLGGKANLIYAIMRGTQLPPEELVRQFSVARDIDPKYAKASIEALRSGVKMRILVLGLNENGIVARGYFSWAPQ